jgi:hypothetical protein
MMTVCADEYAACEADVGGANCISCADMLDEDSENFGFVCAGSGKLRDALLACACEPKHCGATR